METICTNELCSGSSPSGAVQAPFLPQAPSLHYDFLRHLKAPGKAIQGLPSKDPFTISHSHQENSPALSNFSLKKSLPQRIQELGGKEEPGERMLWLSTFFSENIPAMRTGFFIFMSMQTIGMFYELFLIAAMWCPGKSIRMTQTWFKAPTL